MTSRLRGEWGSAFFCLKTIDLLSLGGGGVKKMRNFTGRHMCMTPNLSKRLINFANYMMGNNIVGIKVPGLNF